MFTEQIQQFHTELTKRCIKGDIQNNELVWCKGIATLRALIEDKWQSVTLNPNADNTAAINKLTKIIDKQVKSNASKNTKSM